VLKSSITIQLLAQLKNRLAAEQFSVRVDYRPCNIWSNALFLY